MPILLDFWMVALGGSTTYATGFLHALAKRTDLTDLVVLLPNSGFATVEQQLSRGGCGVRRGPTATAGTWRSRVQNQIVVPWISIGEGAGVVFVPRDIAPLLTPARLVILARNLIVWESQTAGSTPSRTTWRVQHISGWLSARRSAQVLAVSRVMAKRMGPLGAPAVVIHHGCDLDVDEVEWPHGSDPSPALRVLALGTIFRHKRFDVVIEAVGELVASLPRVRLEIWGDLGDPAETQRLRSRGHKILGYDPVRGPLDIERRAEVLRACDVLAMGSSFESFGLPMIEAMRTGTLVWAPKSDLLEEICGQAAAGYDEGSPRAAAAALLASLPNAQGMINAGRERSLEFTWERCVDQTITRLRSVAHRPTWTIERRRRVWHRR